MRREWSSEPQNLLSPEVVSAIRDALRVGMLFGVRTRYDAPEPCAYSDLESYIRSMKECVPGDAYTLWSVESLARQGRLLLRKRGEVLNKDELERIQSWLNSDPRQEFVAAGRPNLGAPAEGVWGDCDFFDRLEELASRCCPQGELAVMSLNDHQESDREWRPTHHLFHALVPNERGEVPVFRP